MSNESLIIKHVSGMKYEAQNMRSIILKYLTIATFSENQFLCKTRVISDSASG